MPLVDWEFGEPDGDGADLRRRTVGRGALDLIEQVVTKRPSSLGERRPADVKRVDGCHEGAVDPYLDAVPEKMAEDSPQRLSQLSREGRDPSMVQAVAFLPDHDRARSWEVDFGPGRSRDPFRRRHFGAAR